MDIRKLQRAIVDGLEDVKAQNIVVFNTERLSPLFERVIIASGTSNRQTRALANSVREAVKERGLPVPRTEGEDNGEWIIVDCGAAVVHVMQPAIRAYYHLEELWGEKPVRMKLDGSAYRHAAEHDDHATPRAPKPSRKAQAPRAKTASRGESRAAPGATKAGAARKTVASAGARSKRKPVAKAARVRSVAPPARKAPKVAKVPQAPARKPAKATAAKRGAKPASSKPATRKSAPAKRSVRR